MLYFYIDLLLAVSEQTDPNQPIQEVEASEQQD